MVAINDNFHYHGAAAQRGRSRWREFAQAEKDLDQGCSDPSVSSVAGKYSNCGFTGNMPNGTADYIWSGRPGRAGIFAGGALAGERLQQVVEERDSSNAPIRQYVWGTFPGAAALTRPSASTGFWQQDAGLRNLNIDECIELTTFVALGIQNLEPGSYYLLQDLLYRAVALTNSAGAVVEAYDTDAYGNTLIFTGPGADGVWFTDDDVQSAYGANEIIHCGYRYDPETDLYYVRNRSYNAVLGRWVQRDPIGYAGGTASQPDDAAADITGSNLYEYAKSRPAVLLDPLGLDACDGNCPVKWQAKPVLGVVWQYGCYCGLGQAPGRQPPIDALDKCCQAHDDCYGKHPIGKRHGCDCTLRKCAEDALLNGNCFSGRCEQAVKAIMLYFCTKGHGL